MHGIGTTFEQIAAFLDRAGEPYMAVMVRQQVAQLQNCREANRHNVAALHALREQYEPRINYGPRDYRSPAESDG